MFGSLRRPEYTGGNRCLPCTVVNSLIAVALAAAVAVGLTGVTGTAGVLGGAGAVLAASFALIYLRGYLVPGTPTLTKRYFPAWALHLFGKDPAPGAPVGAVEGSAERATDRTGDIDIERVLLDAGAVEPCDDRDDLCLTERFRTAWNAEIETVRAAGVDAETVVAKLSLDAAEYEIEDHGEGRVLRAGSGGGATAVGKWPSAAALVADSAAAAVLDSRYDGWDGLGPVARGQVLSGLRIFLADCPTGEGGVEFGQETVESCCSTHEVVAVTCSETGERLFEQPLQE